jgi:hypothetical protein
MSQSTADRVDFEFPERIPNQPPLFEASRISQIIADTIPYTARNSLYRPDKAFRAGGGNCFAQTLGGVSLMREWDIPSGVLLTWKPTRMHAQAVAILGEQPFFLEPDDLVLTLKQQAKKLDARRRGPVLRKTYRSARIAEGLIAGDYVRYFFRDQQHEPDTWQVEAKTNMRELSNPKTAVWQHIIMDDTRGEAALLAIGDLMRYGERDQAKLAERYDTLIEQVPSFIPVPAPPDAK